ncbi:MAG: InlB B-repeat-containing protein, partial [Propionibacteriaceae bacterium]|nr:InlB B-repeat-containing protein [Propionibacteriaceae bacterium]
KITFNAQGGKGAAAVSFKYQAKMPKLPNTTKAGYTFKGWYTAPTGGKKVAKGNKITQTGPFTLYAQWTPKSYTVKFDANGGSAPKIGTKKVTSKKVFNGQPYGTLPTSSKGKAPFDGWYTAKTGGVKVTATSAVKLTKNTTLYARWLKPSKITLTGAQTQYVVGAPFNRSAGKLKITYPGMDPITVSLSDKNISITGFNSKKAGTKTVSIKYAGLQTPYKFKVNVVKTAKITFDAQGGKAASAVSFTYKAKLPALPTTSKAGYTFKGWYTEPTGGKKMAKGDKITKTGPFTLYAQWTAAKTITTGTVTAGAFCTPVGAKGVTSNGTKMVCKTTAEDPRARWRAA